MIIPYSPTMKITNLEQLPRGKGLPYLEVLRSMDGEYIAIQWRLKPRKKLPTGRVNIKFAT